MNEHELPIFKKTQINLSEYEFVDFEDSKHGCMAIYTHKNKGNKIRILIERDQFKVEARYETD